MNIRHLTAAWSLLAALLVTAPLASAETVIVRAARLLDLEQVRYLKDQAIRIENGRVAAIAPYAAGAAVDSHVIDWSAYMVRYGLSPLGAIRAATSDAARCLGQELDLGSVAPGKFADMIAVTGDPLADVETLRKVAGVIKEGRLITGSHP